MRVFRADTVLKVCSREREGKSLGQLYSELVAAAFAPQEEATEEGRSSTSCGRRKRPIPRPSRALLRTSRYLNGTHHDQLVAMRNERDARRLRETLHALRATGGNVLQAAEILKMSESSLNYLLKQLGLR